MEEKTILESPAGEDEDFKVEISNEEDKEELEEEGGEDEPEVSYSDRMTMQRALIVAMNKEGTDKFKEQWAGNYGDDFNRIAKEHPELVSGFSRLEGGGFKAKERIKDMIKELEK